MNYLSKLVIFIILISVINCKNEVVWEYNFQGSNNHVVKKYYPKHEYKELELYKEYLFFGVPDITKNSGFYIFNKYSGKELYHNITGNNKYKIDGGNLYIAGDQLIKIRLSDLKVIWTYDIKNKLVNPYISETSVYIMPDRNGKNFLYSIDKFTGKKRWMFPVDTITFRFNYSHDNNILYYTQKSGIIALNALKKEVVWDLPNSKIRYFNLILHNDYLIVFGGTKKTISAVNKNTGKIIWRKKILDHYSLYRYPKPIVYNNIIYIGDEKYIYAINFTDGQEIWKKKHSNFLLDIKIISNKLYIATRGRDLIYQYNLQTGKLLNEIKLNNIIISPFEYKDGVIYYRNENMLYAEKVKL